MPVFDVMLWYRVFLISDAVSSQRPADRAAAFQRLTSAGAVVTSSESAIYELCGDAKHPAFKPIVGYVKELATARATWNNKPNAAIAADIVAASAASAGSAAAAVSKL